MRIRLSIGGERRSDYINIDPYNGDHKQDITNFDNICLDSECTALFLDDCLQRLSIEEVGAVFTYFRKKLRLNATITILSPCLDELVRLYTLGEIDEPMLNRILYGNLGNIRRGCYTMDSVVQLLEHFGLTITKKSYNGMNMIVEAKRCT